MIANPYETPNDARSDFSGIKRSSSFFGGMCSGAKWSLVLAVPFGVWVFYQLYQINTFPKLDPLTDARIPNPFTFQTFLRCASGAVLIPLIMVVLPASIANGIFTSLRNQSNAQQSNG